MRNATLRICSLIYQQLLLQEAENVHRSQMRQNEEGGWQNTCCRAGFTDATGNFSIEKNQMRNSVHGGTGATYSLFAVCLCTSEKQHSFAAGK
jgi:hypothetical protein